MDDEDPERVLIDVRGLKCPLPALKAAKRMADHPSGTRFLVLATDPLAAIDIPHFCGEQGYVLTASNEEGGTLRFELAKA